MQKNIKPWAESGTKVAMTEAEVSNGWEGNDQPAAENWNHIQNERDNQQISDAEGRAVRLFGLHPSNLRGSDDSGIPVFRPNAFTGEDAIWNPSSIANKYSGLRIHSASLGWDPANDMPVLVTLDAGSVISPGSSAQLRFFHCWDYSAEALTPEVRTIYFGFVSDSDEANMPILVSGGFLYVSVAANATGYRYLLKYDLSSWTGNHAGAKLHAQRPVNVTEIVETKDGNLGMFEQYTTNVSGDIYNIRYNRIKADLSVQSVTLSVSGCESLSKACRTDGAWAYSYGRDSDDYPVVIAQEVETFSSTPEIYAPGSSYSAYHVADLLPVQSGTEHPTGDKSVVCLIRKSTAPYGPNFRLVGSGDSFDWLNKSFGIVDADEDFFFQRTTPGAFCCFGASTFLILNREIVEEGSSYSLEIAKIEKSQFLRSNDYGYISSNSVEGVIVGDALESTDQELLLHTRGFHDGRSVWVADCYGGKIYRVVAPEIRCGK